MEIVQPESTFANILYLLLSKELSMILSKELRMILRNELRII